jgi:hypothetical protein
MECQLCMTHEEHTVEDCQAITPAEIAEAYAVTR